MPSKVRELEVSLNEIFVAGSTAAFVFTQSFLPFCWRCLLALLKDGENDDPRVEVVEKREEESAVARANIIYVRMQSMRYACD